MTTDLVDALRALSHADLRVLFEGARLCDGWSYCNDDGEHVDEDDEENEETIETGYLGSYGDLGSPGRVSRLQRGQWTGMWVGFADDGAAGSLGRFDTRAEAEAAVEKAVIAAGWRVPWR